MQPHILIADDDIDIISTLRLLLKNEGGKLTQATSPNEILSLANQNDLDLILIDLNFVYGTASKQENLSLLEKLQTINNTLPIIVMNKWQSIELAVKVLQYGASDFIKKPCNNKRLIATFHNQLLIRQKIRQLNELKKEKRLLKLKLNQTASSFIAHSPSMQAIMSIIERVAKTDLSIFITGENGTGKSMLAQYIHSVSHRANNSYISVNMAGISEDLFESEMFGHVKGFFTDAREERIGKFELADTGTLFLDEIGSVPVSLQAKMLRVLEESRFEKVGANQTQNIDVRIISATNAPITELCTTGQFRQDLLYRLNAIEIYLPPLRERKEDIPLLVEQLIERTTKKYRRKKPQLTRGALKAIYDYHWPGNIRELSHTIERSILLSAETIHSHHLYLPRQSALNSLCLPEKDEIEPSMEELEKQIILERMKKYDGNALIAAKSLDMSKSAFYRRLEKYKPERNNEGV